MEKPALLLLPNLLGDLKHHQPYLPASVDKAVATLDGLIAESEKGGRRFLSRFETKKLTKDIPIALLNEHTKDEDMDFLLAPIREGERWGVISDCGLPCLSDPGSKLVQRARLLGIPVQAFVGPSSIVLSLMLSGFPGQKFCFNGYLGKDPQKRRQEILELEKNSKKTQTTHLFIEAPYRNQETLEMLLNTLSDDTSLCVASDLTLPTQSVVSQKIKLWKKSPPPNLLKKPAIFLICIE